LKTRNLAIANRSRSAS